MTVIVGVDPGLSGAIAFLGEGRELEIFDMPTLEVTRNRKAKRDLNYHEIGRIFEGAGDVQDFYVEGVSSMPGQGISSAFAFGKAAGAVIGVAAANFWRITEVPPVTWRRAVGLKSGEGKDASRALATHLFPNHSALFARKKDDGRAEATLIAWYGRIRARETQECC